MSLRTSRLQHLDHSLVIYCVEQYGSSNWYPSVMPTLADDGVATALVYSGSGEQRKAHILRHVGDTWQEGIETLTPT